MEKNNKNKVHIDLILMMLLRVFNMIVPIITAPYLSRIFGPEGIGTNSYYFSIVQYFGLFVLLGIGYYGTSQSSIVKEDRQELSRVFKSIYLLQFILLISVSTIYLLSIFIILPDDIYLFVVYVLFLVSVGIDISWFFQGIESFKFIVIINFITKIISTIMIFIFIRTPDDLFIYALIVCLSGIFTNLLLWWKVTKIVDIKTTRINFSDIKPIVKPIILLFVPIISVSIYKIMDKVMIGILSSKYELGIYESAEKLITLILGLTTTLGVIMLPKISNLLKSKNLLQIKKIFNDSIVFMLFISIPIIAFILILSDTFIPFFYGEGFMDSIRVINILSYTVLLISFGNVIVTQYLIPNQKNKLFIYSVLFGAIFNFVFNLILLPHYGAYGAAISTLVTEMIVLSIQIYASRRLFDVKKIIKYMILLTLAIIPFILTKPILQYIYIDNPILRMTVYGLLNGTIYLLLTFVYYVIFIKKNYLRGDK